MTMKSRSTIVATLLLIALTPIDIATAAGRSTTTSVNTILNGKGAPKNSLGIDGDFYIDTRSLLLFGPKAKGKWPTPQSIQGPTGPSGNDGKNGSDGKAISSTSVSNVAGPAGPQGATGAPGLAGSQGPQGVQGEKGEPGPQGPAGSSGANGSQGPAGATGAQGPIGLTGATGAKGETGTVGPSEVTVVNILPITIATSVAYSFVNSESFGVLRERSSYKFEIFLRGTSNLNDLVLGAELISSGNVLDYSYIRSDFRYATYSGAFASYGFVLVGVVRVESAPSSFSIRIIDGRGETGVSPLTLSGKAYITLVGAIR